MGASELPAPEEIATVHLPTLILAGETDPLHPVSTARRLHDLMSESTLRVDDSVAEIKRSTNEITGFFAS